MFFQGFNSSLMNPSSNFTCICIGVTKTNFVNLLALFIVMKVFKSFRMFCLFQTNKKKKVECTELKGKIVRQGFGK